ncbi:MAG: hypothetical protein AB1611_15090 [bacterium]
MTIQFKTIAPALLAEKKRLIEQAAQGPASEKRNTGYDMGEKSYSCYQIDPVTGTEKKIELQVSGDWSYSNQSEAAQALIIWLRDIERGLP